MLILFLAFILYLLIQLVPLCDKMTIMWLKVKKKHHNNEHTGVSEDPGRMSVRLFIRVGGEEQGTILSPF